MSATELLPDVAPRTDLAPLDAVLLMYRDTENPLAELLGSGLEAANVRVRYKQWPAKAFHRAKTGSRPRILHIQWVDLFFSRPTFASSVRSGVRFLAEVAAKKRQGVRLVWTVHDIHMPESRHVTTEHVFQTLLARLVDGMIVRSEASARHVGAAFHYPAAKFSVIPHGHYGAWYPNDITRSRARARLGLPERGRVLLFFGAIRKYKGLPQLFEAFRRVRRDDVALLVAGWPRPEGLAEWTREQAALDKRVRVFPYRIPDNEVQHFFNAADAFVLPVRDDSTAASGSLALAATFGKAIIAPDQDWIFDPLPRAGAVVYDRKDADALRSALERALDADLESMGEANREHIMPWGWDRVALLTRRVYEGEHIRIVPQGGTSE